MGAGIGQPRAAIRRRDRLFDGDDGQSFERKHCSILAMVMPGRGTIVVIPGRERKLANPESRDVVQMQDQQLGIPDSPLRGAPE
jgi:hypothetical protein